jgi:hypothetical protein
VSEHDALLALVTEECQHLGLWWLYVPATITPPEIRPRDRWRAQGSSAGWPDLVILGARAALFAELKSDDGRRDLAQIDLACRLTGAGLTYRLWRTADWDAGIIEHELHQLAGVARRSGCRHCLPGERARAS